MNSHVIQVGGESVDADTQENPADCLERKLTQLRSLLSCCYGDGIEWFDAIGATDRDNIMWIAADLAAEAVRLAQVVLSRESATQGLEAGLGVG